MFQQTLMPWLIEAFADIPLLSTLFAGPPYGIGMFTAALILSIMTIPFISAITRDVFETVPPVLKEAAFGLGATKWETIREVVLPYARGGIIGAVMLGFGRALGETMAVTMVIGNAPQFKASLFALPKLAEPLRKVGLGRIQELRERIEAIPTAEQRAGTNSGARPRGK